LGKEEILRPAIGFTCLPAHLFTCSSTTCSAGQKPAFLIEQVKVEQAIRRTHKAGLRELLPREFTPHVLGVFFASRRKKKQSPDASGRSPAQLFTGSTTLRTALEGGFFLLAERASGRAAGHWRFEMASNSAAVEDIKFACDPLPKLSAGQIPLGLPGLPPSIRQPIGDER